MPRSSRLEKELISSNSFNSSSIAYNNGDQLSFAHNWDRFDPQLDFYLFSAWVNCQIPQAGWEQGEKALLNTQVTIWVDLQSVHLIVSKTGLSLNAKSGKQSKFVLNSNNWLVSVQGFRGVR